MGQLPSSKSYNAQLKKELAKLLKKNGVLIIDEAGGKVSDIREFGDEAIDIRASNSNIYQKMLEKIKNF